MPVLTSSGSPTFAGGACTFDGTDLLTAPASLIDKTQGWAAARLQPSWAAASPTGTNCRIFQETGDHLDLFYDTTLKLWAMESTNSANTVEQARGAVQTFAA